MNDFATERDGFCEQVANISNIWQQKLQSLTNLLKIINNKNRSVLAELNHVDDFHTYYDVMEWLQSTIPLQQQKQQTDYQQLSQQLAATQENLANATFLSEFVTHCRNLTTQSILCDQVWDGTTSHLITDLQKAIVIDDRSAAQQAIKTYEDKEYGRIKFFWFKNISDDDRIEFAETVQALTTLCQPEHWRAGMLDDSQKSWIKKLPSDVSQYMLIRNAVSTYQQEKSALEMRLLQMGDQEKLIIPYDSSYQHYSRMLENLYIRYESSHLYASFPQEERSTFVLIIHGHDLFNDYFKCRNTATIMQQDIVAQRQAMEERLSTNAIFFEVLSEIKQVVEHKIAHSSVEANILNHLANPANIAEAENLVAARASFAMLEQINEPLMALEIEKIQQIIDNPQQVAAIMREITTAETGVSAPAQQSRRPLPPRRQMNI
ncbi:MAG: hypothetical protein ACOYK8_05675 [Alphaproteobacteria bacterium]